MAAPIFISCFILIIIPVYGLTLQKNNDDKYSVTIRMPDAVSKQHDALLCHAFETGPEEAYILKFEPHATKKVAHHMMVYGCGRPGSNQPYWQCAAMDDRSDRSVCGDGERQILWAWAMDAEGRTFPNDVGFRIGGDTQINYIVIQLHYSQQFTDGQTDTSGVTLHMTRTPQHFQAGYYVLYNHGYIPPMVDEFHIESACEFNQSYSIHPLAYRTHAHNLGVVSSGYHIRNGSWMEIGRMSPQLPQTFYNATNQNITVQKGDILASRCTMSSQRQSYTTIGSEHSDEMCNFYIMYYTEYRGPLRIDYCVRDAQHFHWADYLNDPPKTASSIEGLPSFTRIDPLAVESPSKMNRETLM